MEYRNLGRTGTKVSMLCLGCLMFGGKTKESDRGFDIPLVISPVCCQPHGWLGVIFLWYLYFLIWHVFPLSTGLKLN